MGLTLPRAVTNTASALLSGAAAAAPFVPFVGGGAATFSPLLEKAAANISSSQVDLYGTPRTGLQSLTDQQLLALRNAQQSQPQQPQQPTNQDAGNVLDSISLGGGGYSQPSISTGLIRDIYGQVRGGLQNQIGLAQSLQSQLAQQAGQQYATQTGILDRNRQLGLQNIAQARQNIQQKTAETLSDLTRQIRQQLQAGALQLGATGGADSSASSMMNYALARLQNENRQRTLAEANRSLSAADLEQERLNTEYQNQLAQLQQARDSLITQLTQDFAAKRAELQSRLQNASVEEAKALAAQNEALARQALASIQNIDTNLNSYAAQLRQKMQEAIQAANANVLGGIGQDIQPQISGTDVQGLRLAPDASALDQITFVRKKKKDTSQGV